MIIDSLDICRLINVNNVIIASFENIVSVFLKGQSSEIDLLGSSRV